MPVHVLFIGIRHAVPVLNSFTLINYLLITTDAGGEAARACFESRRVGVCGLGSSAPRYRETYQRAAKVHLFTTCAFFSLFSCVFGF